MGGLAGACLRDSQRVFLGDQLRILLLAPHDELLYYLSIYLSIQLYQEILDTQIGAGALQVNPSLLKKFTFLAL